MPVFQIGLDDGRSLRIEADDQQAALAGVQHFMNTEKANAPSGAVAGLQQGLANEIQGVGETAKQFLGVDNSNTNTQAAKVAPKNYHGAQIVPEGGHWYNPLSYNWKQVPQALAEAAPGIGTDLAVGMTAGKMAGPWAGLAAGVGSGLVRTLGNSAKEDATIRTGNPDAQPELQDKARAAATGIVSSIPQAVGLSRFIPGFGKAASKTVAGMAGRALTNTAVEGGSAQGSDLINQVGSTIGTPGGTKVDLNRAENAAVIGGLGGGLLSAPAIPGRALRNYKTREFTGENEQASQAVANRIQTAADGDKLNPSGGFEAVKTASGDVKTELKDAVSQVGPLPEEATSALRRAGEGRALTGTDFDNISQAVGDSPAGDRILGLARQAHVISLLKKQGDFDNQSGKFTGGALHGVSNQIRALRSPAGALATTGIGYALGTAPGLFAYSPHTLAGIGGLAGVLRGVDALTGSRSPTSRFVDRFATAGSPVRAPINTALIPKPEDYDSRSGPWGQRPPQSPVPQVAAPEAPAPIDPLNLPADMLKRSRAISKAMQMTQKLRDKSTKDFANEATPLLKQLAARNAAQKAAAAQSANTLPEGFSQMLGGPTPEPSEGPLDLPATFSRSLGGQAAPTNNSVDLLNQFTQQMAAKTPSPPLAPEAPAAPQIDPLNLPADMLKRSRTIAKAAAMVKKMRDQNAVAEAKAQAAQEPAVVSKITKQSAQSSASSGIAARALAKLNAQRQAEPEGFAPIGEDRQWRNMLTDDQVAQHELADYQPEVRAKYARNVTTNRAAKRDLMHEFAENASDKDAAIAGALYKQLDHISRRNVAKLAIDHYAAQMSPEGAAALRAKLTSAKLAELWSKE